MHDPLTELAFDFCFLLFLSNYYVQTKLFLIKLIVSVDYTGEWRVHLA